MKILNDGLAAKDANLIVTAITGNSPEDIAADILELNDSKISVDTELAATKQDLAAKNVELATTKQDLADAIKLNDTHEKTIEVLGKAAPAATTVVDKNPSFEYGGSTYGFKFQALTHKGVKITPTEVCADTALQAELVKMQSGMIYKK